MVVLTPLCFFLQPVIRLYAVPLSAFTAEDEEDEGPEQIPKGEVVSLSHAYEEVGMMPLAMPVNMYEARARSL